MKRNVINFQSAVTRATLRKQAEILEWLSLGDGMTVSEIGTALGISRQLALYHLKKMAAASKLVMVLEPCVGNGGLQFRVWDRQAVAARWLSRAA